MDGPKKKNNIRQIIWKIRAKKVILATGSIERFLTFDNNDRPGIMLACSARRYLNHYGVSQGGNVVVFTNNDTAYQTAIDFYREGIKVQAIVDVRNESNGDLPKIANKFGIPIYYNHVVIFSF